MTKLQKVSMKKTEDGKIIYIYNKTDDNGKTRTIKTVYEPASPDRLVVAVDLIQRMKSDGISQYENKIEQWKEYQKRSLTERAASVPYKYGRFLKLNRFKTELHEQVYVFY